MFIGHPLCLVQIRPSVKYFSPHLPDIAGLGERSWGSLISYTSLYIRFVPAELSVLEFNSLSAGGLQLFVIKVASTDLQCYRWSTPVVFCIHRAAKYYKRQTNKVKSVHIYHPTESCEAFHCGPERDSVAFPCFELNQFKQLDPIRRIFVPAVSKLSIMASY